MIQTLKHNNKKRKKSSFYEDKRLVGLTPDIFGEKKLCVIVLVKLTTLISLMNFVFATLIRNHSYQVFAFQKIFQSAHIKDNPLTIVKGQLINDYTRTVVSNAYSPLSIYKKHYSLGNLDIVICCYGGLLGTVTLRCKRICEFLDQFINK